MIKAIQERDRNIALELSLLTVVQRWFEENENDVGTTFDKVRTALADIIQKVINSGHTPYFYEQSQGSLTMHTTQIEPGLVIDVLRDDRSPDLTIKTIQGETQSSLARLAEIYVQADEMASILDRAGEHRPQFIQEIILDAGTPQKPSKSTKTNSIDRSHLEVYTDNDYYTVYELACLFAGDQPDDHDGLYPLTGESDWMHTQLSRLILQKKLINSEFGTLYMVNEDIAIGDFYQWASQHKKPIVREFATWLTNTLNSQGDSGKQSKPRAFGEQISHLAEELRNSDHERARQADEILELKDQLLDASTRRSNLERRIDNLEAELLEAITSENSQIQAQKTQNHISTWSGFDDYPDKLRAPELEFCFHLHAAMVERFKKSPPSNLKPEEWMKNILEKHNARIDGNPLLKDAALKAIKGAVTTKNEKTKEIPVFDPQKVPSW